MSNGYRDILYALKSADAELTRDKRSERGTDKDTDDLESGGTRRQVLETA